VDGLTYLTSLDDGLPQIPNLGSYIRIVKDKSALRKLAAIGQHITNRALSAEENPEEILEGAEQSIRGLGDARAKQGGLATVGEVIRQFPGGINAFLDPSHRALGLSTGFGKLDEMTGGLRPAELVILAARPSMGKTALALNIAWHVASQLEKTVAVFSLEMSTASLVNRMLCSIARVDSQRFRAGYLNQTERDKLRRAAGYMMDAPLWIDDSAGIKLPEIGAKLRRLAQGTAGPVGLVIVDYLQLCGARGRSENRNQEVSAMSRGMKLLSKEHNCPFLVLSQLSRATETRTGDHRPQLSDLRESGSIEQDADLVGFIFREEVYKHDREDLRGRAELILAKQRNGPIGKVDLVFLHAQTRFENRAEDLGDLPEQQLIKAPYADQ
jgi:replicative DNA helicase